MDLFDRFERRFAHMWDFWDEEWQELDNAFKILDKDDVNNEKSIYSKSYHYEIGSNPENNYSLSYHYETGMKEPEIKIHGNPSQETIDKFLSSIKTRHNIQLSDEKINQLTDGSKKPEIKKFELIMPGIGKEDISYEIDGKNLKVLGKRDNHEYRKKLRIGYKPDKIEIETNNGIVNITIYPEKNS